MSEEIDNKQDKTGYEGAKILLPQLKKWSTSKFYDYEANVVDYESLENLNQTVNRARLALFKVADMINNYERLEVEAKTNYERAYRRAYLESTEKTETAKKARAELVTEDLENEYITNTQVKNELIRMSNTLRLELQTLQSVGHNMRQQLKVE